MFIPTTQLTQASLGFAPIGFEVLGADTASIDISGISQSYEHLFVLMLLRTTEAVVASSVAVTFNGDTGANYDRNTMQNLNTTVTGVSSLAQTSISDNVAGANAQAGAVTPIKVVIPGYSLTVFHKAFEWQSSVVEDTAADNRQRLVMGRWRSTVAITQITVTAGSGSLLAGSGVWVYGIG